VVALAEALIQGLQDVGSHAIGKHFPGHGYVEADSHHDLPVDERSFDEIVAEDLEPFRQLARVLTGVMPAHVLYSECDRQPAGFSSFWLKAVLRGSLHFNGVILSDDLSMAGAHQAGTPVHRAQAAFDAGCDMVLLCNDPESHDTFMKGVESLYYPHDAAQQRLEGLRMRHVTEARQRYEEAREKLSEAPLTGYHPR
jgi:beta-N-acetylhexosaminidase